TRQLLSVAISLPPTLPEDTAVSIASMAGRLGFSAVHLAEAPTAALLSRLADAAAPALVVVDASGDAAGVVRVYDLAEVAAARAQMNASDATRPLLVAVPISIGRTMNEAVARADLEPRFIGARHPRDVGIFGTLEQAQAQVLALARAGADGLVLDVPVERDVADVLAQIRALVVGATPELLNASAAANRTPPPRTVFYGN
ncbi:MAG: hypothetical protein ACRDOK_21115, partial [Streptosporangiaceae bacterium]